MSSKNLVQYFLSQKEENRIVNGSRRYPMGTDLTIPLDNMTIESIIEYNSDIYNSSYRNSPAWKSDFEASRGHNYYLKSGSGKMLFFTYLVVHHFSCSK